MNREQFLILSRSDLEAYAEYISMRLHQSMQRFGRITTDTLRAIEPTFGRVLETSQEIRETT